MIEIVIATLIQLATLSTDATAVTADDQSATQTETTQSTDGGTGSWDDNGVYAN